MIDGAYSRVGSIDGIQLPDFHSIYVFSRKQTSTTEAEYRKKIMDQACKDYGCGQFQNESSSFNWLLKWYTSEVSPDREGIIIEGLKAIAQKRINGPKATEVVVELREGNVKYQESLLEKLDYIEFYDSEDEKIAAYSNKGWSMYITDEEVERQAELCSVYNEVWKIAKEVSKLKKAQQ